MKKFIQFIINLFYMRKIFYILLSLGIFTFFCSSVIASQGPPSPVCEIEANILKIGSALDAFDIKITAVNKMINEGYQIDYQEFSCDSYKNQTIEGTSIRSQGDFKVGQKIKGNLSYFIDEFTPGGAMVLDDVIIISEPTESITKKLLVEKSHGAKQINYSYFLVPVFLIILIGIIYIIFKKKK